MDTRGVQEGMTVRSADGEKLGKVVQCAEGYFLVEKGFFFPKDYLARYDQVREIRDDEIHLNQTAAALQEPTTGAEAYEERAPGSIGATTVGSDMGAGARATPDVRDADQVRVTLSEEELEAQKKEREAGAVRVRKEVVTEHKQVTVPVAREEVHVERVPASEATPGEATFKEETISMPIREEEVEITKKPRVKEEIRVSKTRTQVEQRAEADIRKEEARIEREGDVREGGAERTEPKE